MSTTNSRKNGLKRKRRSKQKLEFPLPPHANAEPHKRLMKRLRKMTPDEFFKTLVDAGIYTKTGRLTKRYAPKPDDHLAR